MSKRLTIKELVPDAYQNIMQLSELVSKTGIDKLQQELIKIRASQINKCAFCLGYHSQEALKSGEDPKRLNVLSAWKEAKDWFSQEDQVILKLTEEITLIAENGLCDETYEKAVTLFGEEKTAKIIMAVININALNRMGVSQRLQPIR